MSENNQQAWSELLSAAEAFAHASHVIAGTPERNRLLAAIEAVKGDTKQATSSKKTINGFTGLAEEKRQAREAVIARVMARNQKVSWLGKLFGRKPMTREEAIESIRHADKYHWSLPEESFEFIERYYSHVATR